MPKYIDEYHKIIEGAEAEQLLKNAYAWPNQRGVLSVSQERWLEAQRYERRCWMELNLGAKQDRQNEHAEMFKLLKWPEIWAQNAIEIGCGPFTNILRIIKILDSCAGKISLLDPLLNDYLNHPGCTYAGTTCTKYPTSIEQFEPSEEYDLIVSINVIQHIQSVDVFFTKIKSMAKNGAYLIFCDAAYDDNNIFEVYKSLYDAGHPIILPAGILYKYLLSLGEIIDHREKKIESDPYRLDHYLILKIKKEN